MLTSGLLGLRWRPLQVLEWKATELIGQQARRVIKRTEEFGHMVHEILWWRTRYHPFPGLDAHEVEWAT